MCLQALAGVSVRFLGVKAKSFMRLISKAPGQEREMSEIFLMLCPTWELSISDLNTNIFTLIYSLVKGNINEVGMLGHWQLETNLKKSWDWTNKKMDILCWGPTFETF